MTTALLDHNKFIEQMKMKKLTQEKVAERIGITDRHVRNLRDKDTNISASLLYRMSQLFQIPMENLLILLEEETE